MKILLQANITADKPHLVDTKDGNESTKKYECTTDPNCIGYLKKGGENSTVKVYENDFKNLLYSKNEVVPKGFYMKLKEIDMNNEEKFTKKFPHGLTKELSYFREPIEPFSSNMNKKESFIEGIEDMKYNARSEALDVRYENYKTKQDNFKASFERFASAFNALSENEIKMLDQTNIKINDLKNLVNTYDELYQKSKKNMKIKELVYNQADNSSISHRNSEYSMAFAGILSIGSLMYLFTKVK